MGTLATTVATLYSLVVDLSDGRSNVYGDDNSGKYSYCLRRDQRLQSCCSMTVLPA